MSKVKIEGNASGTGTLTISAPNTNTDRSLTLPDGAGEIFVGDITSSDLPAGSVLQVVQTNDNTSTTSTSTSYVDTNLTASITPTSTSNKILVMLAPHLYVDRNGVSNNYGDCFFNIVRGSTQVHESRIAINFGTTSWGDFMQRSSLIYLDSPSTTSSTTYKMQIRSSGYSVVNNVGTYGNSTITLLEIAG